MSQSQQQQQLCISKQDHQTQSSVTFIYDTNASSDRPSRIKSVKETSSRPSVSSVFDMSPLTPLSPMSPLHVTNSGKTTSRHYDRKYSQATARALTKFSRRVECLGGWSFLLLVLGIFCLLPGTIVTGIYVREA